MDGLAVKITWVPNAKHYKVTLIIGKHVFVSFPNKRAYETKDGLDPIMEEMRIKADLVATMQE
jgi:hypothetical protein